ncbi:hypothetical protein [Streptomyces sp. S.PNR 29]|uniref:hypothetical protein n=1 Tax=Streptomyces sp. S.PNR 29 TaxID=2973805 RepID=UPI0025B1FC78|nr:hypothetical protein [Streptomyces sp. S.PNR 29]MDN0199156.1 hypothetical protein [Streptomyces sp. S.PNR 29]
MKRSVVFVHGTGVREKSYNSTFATVRTEIHRIRPGWEVRGCLWGPAQGAKFVRGGISVPGYARSGGGDRTADRDASIAEWDVLYNDPGYELRLLGLRPPPKAGVVRGIPPTKRFLRTVQEFRPSADLVERLDRHGLCADFETALRAVADSPEVRDAATTIDQNGYEHRHAVAKAVVAATLAGAEARGADALAGPARDALLAALSTELSGESRALTGKVAQAVKTSALRAATRWTVDRRGSLSDGMLPMVGDILRYQARGEGIRELIRRTVEHTPGDKVTLLAHSLGGVAAVDLLAMERLDRVDQLVTVGSQAALLYECGALTACEHPDTLPAHFPAAWLNIHDPWDLLSYAAAAVFKGHAHDLEVSNGQPFPHAHSAYWSNAEVWDAVSAWLS